jgi:hypothetical protein
VTLLKLTMTIEEPLVSVRVEVSVVVLSAVVDVLLVLDGLRSSLVQPKTPP